MQAGGIMQRIVIFIVFVFITGFVTASLGSCEKKSALKPERVSTEQNNAAPPPIQAPESEVLEKTENDGKTEERSQEEEETAAAQPPAPPVQIQAVPEPASPISPTAAVTDEALQRDAPLMQITEIAKTNPDKDRRFHYVVFTVASVDGQSDSGRYFFALRQKNRPAPSSAQLRQGAGLHRRVTSEIKTVLLTHTLDSGIKDFIPTMNHQEVIHGSRNGVDVNRYFLIPGETYTLYAVKDGSDEVKKLKDFTTDAVQGELSLTADSFLDPAVYTDTYTYDKADGFIVIPLGFVLPNSGFNSYAISLGGRIPLIGGISFNASKPMGKPSFLSQSAILVPELSSQADAVISLGGQEVWYAFLYLLAGNSIADAGPVEFQHTISRRVLQTVSISAD